MAKFKVGDWVYAEDWCFGHITYIEDNIAFVEFHTGTGGGCVPFELDKLKLAKPPKKTVTYIT